MSSKDKDIVNITGREEFNRIVKEFEKSIHLIKKFKVRSDVELDRINNLLTSELEKVPAYLVNDYINYVKQFQEAVKSSKNIEFDLKNEYEDYLKELTVLENQSTYLVDKNHLLMMKNKELAEKLFSLEQRLRFMREKAFRAGIASECEIEERYVKELAEEERIRKEEEEVRKIYENQVNVLEKEKEEKLQLQKEEEEKRTKELKKEEAKKYELLEGFLNSNKVDFNLKKPSFLTQTNKPSNEGNKEKDSGSKEHNETTK